MSVDSALTKTDEAYAALIDHAADVADGAKKMPSTPSDLRQAADRLRATARQRNAAILLVCRYDLTMKTFIDRVTNATDRPEILEICEAAKDDMRACGRGLLKTSPTNASEADSAALQQDVLDKTLIALRLAVAENVRNHPLPGERGGM